MFFSETFLIITELCSFHYWNDSDLANYLEFPNKFKFNGMLWEKCILYNWNSLLTLIFSLWVLKGQLDFKYFFSLKVSVVSWKFQGEFMSRLRSVLHQEPVWRSSLNCSHWRQHWHCLYFVASSNLIWGGYWCLLQLC